MAAIGIKWKNQKLIFITIQLATVLALMILKKTGAMLLKETLEVFQPFKHGQLLCSSCQSVLLVSFIGLYGIIYAIIILESLLMLPIVKYLSWLILDV